MEIFQGKWTGYEIVAVNSAGKIFKMKTKQGVRGVDVTVCVMVTDDGEWGVVDGDDRLIEIKEVKET